MLEFIRSGSAAAANSPLLARSATSELIGDGELAGPAQDARGSEVDRANVGAHNDLHIFAVLV